MQLVSLLTLIIMGSALSCASNQYYNNDISCIDCPQTCATCANTQYCTSCINGYYLVGNSKGTSCQSCSQIYLGCNSCLVNVACVSCNTGYFLNNGICNLCSVRNNFCILCSTDGTICTQCSYPFILVNGQCLSATVSDITGGAVGLPTPSTNATSNTTQLITLLNGTKVAPVKDSNGCNQIQTFFQGKCMTLIKNCVFYQPNGICGYCSEGYVVTVFGDCSVNNRILSCEAGYWLNSKVDLCVKVSPACDYYFPNNGSCINCSASYVWVNNSCVPNVTCNSRQYFYKGVCINVQAACTSFSSNGTCTSCATNFDLQDNVCVVQAGKIIGGNDCEFPCKTCH